MPVRGLHHHRYHLGMRKIPHRKLHVQRYGLGFDDYVNLIKKHGGKLLENKELMNAGKKFVFDASNVILKELSTFFGSGTKKIATKPHNKTHKKEKKHPAISELSEHLKHKNIKTLKYRK